MRSVDLQDQDIYQSFIFIFSFELDLKVIHQFDIPLKYGNTVSSLEILGPQNGLRSGDDEDRFLASTESFIMSFRYDREERGIDFLNVFEINMQGILKYWSYTSRDDSGLLLHGWNVSDTEQQSF